MLGWFATAACLLCCLTPRSSRADEEKTYAGASCHPHVVDMIAGTLGPIDETRHFSAENGSIKNIDVNSGTVDCPIVKSVANDGNLKSVKVYVDFGSVSGTASCTLGVFGSTMQTVGPIPYMKPASKSGSGIQTITFNPTAGLPTAWGAPWSYYQLTCSLPPGAGIRSYYGTPFASKSATVPLAKNGTEYALPIPAVGGGVTAPVYVLHCLLSRGTILRNYEVDEK